MNIRKLRIFYATAMCLNMTKVAKELYISQPSVSQAIREVEEEVGAVLFDRIGKKIYLTNEGEIYLNYARRIINLYEEASEKVKEISNKENGKIKIGASTTIGIYILPDIIREFVEIHKGIEISLTIENTSIIEKLILENKIDFGFVEGKVYSDEINKEMIWRDEIVFICRDKDELGKKDTISAKDVEDQKLIMRERGSGTREIVEAYMRDRDIDYKIFMELGNTEAIKRSVEAGLGIGCISTLCIEDDSKKTRLKKLRLDKEKIERDLSLIIHQDKFINNNMKEFIKFINR